jgi:hypothetical protein
MSRVPPFMSSDSATRKLMPVASGVLAYFPDALMCVSWISRVGNEKHNAGEPLHWAKEKSTDEPDAEVRHLLDFVRGLPPDPGLEPLGDLGHLASKAWRALAHLQRACDRARAEAEAPGDPALDPRAVIPYSVVIRVPPGVRGVVRPNLPEPDPFKSLDDAAARVAPSWDPDAPSGAV